LQSVLIGWLLYADVRRRRAEANAALLASELTHSNRVATAGQLAASIAHEIRQPLTAIVSSAHAGLNWLKRSPPDIGEARHALESVVGQGHRADDVIKHMRAMFRKEPGERSRCPLNDLVRQVLRLAAGRIAAGEVSLKTAFVEPSAVVLCDSIQLQQVFLNLIVNAVEAMAHVPFGSRTLYVSTAVAQRHALITVEDSGPGMDEKTMTQIFDPFFTTKAAGMGMGLSISTSIVEAHGGRLTVSSMPDAGASFQVVLPLSGGL
jgi:C4-dicarboxylate-specific signal transduction histidine kinase